MVYLLCLQIDFFLPFGVEFRRRFVAVALGVPDRGDRQHADDGEGEDKISAVKVTLVVTYDGKECTAASIESKKLTFTCEGKTYEASFVNDVLTITEKA